MHTIISVEEKLPGLTAGLPGNSGEEAAGWRWGFLRQRGGSDRAS
jgi:hypothetical protein